MQLTEKPYYIIEIDAGNWYANNKMNWQFVSSSVYKMWDALNMMSKQYFIRKPVDFVRLNIVCVCWLNTEPETVINSYVYCADW